VRLATYLERTAAGAGVKIKRIAARRQAGGRKDSEHFRPVTLQVSVDAGIEELLRLLYALEKGDRFVRVEQLQLRRGSDEGGASDATLEIMAYEVAAQ